MTRIFTLPSELAWRGGANLNLKPEQSTRHGTDIGRGGIWLNLSGNQETRGQTGRSPLLVKRIDLGSTFAGSHPIIGG
jgi:hypothetical protein